MSALVAVLGLALLFAAFGVLGATIGRWNRGGGCAGDGHGCGACHWSERECPGPGTPTQTTTDTGAAAPYDERSDPGPRLRR